MNVAAEVELYWKLESEERVVETGRAVDLSDGGMAVLSPRPVPVGCSLLLRSETLQFAALSNVRNCAWSGSMYRLGIRFDAKTKTSQSCDAPDYYELLRVSTSAEPEAIERVFRTLVKRYHPDNSETGNAEKFMQICDAWRILSHPARKRAYDDERRFSTGSYRRPLLRSREFFGGVSGEKNRRLAILSLLYRRRANDYQFPGLSILDLENVTGLTREEIGFVIWYLVDMRAVVQTDNTSYSITSIGVDLVENADRTAGSGGTPLLPAFS